MKKKIITIIIITVIVSSIGLALANNKAKINRAANPERETPVIPVKVIDVALDSFNTAFTLNGTTSSDREVKIASEVQGKLIALYVKNGDQVQAGQVLASLDASVYSVRLGSVEASIAKADLDIERYTKLIEMGGATPMQLESAELQRNSLQAERREILEQMSHMQIRAPFSGRIENVAVELGSFVSYGTVLGQLIDNVSLKINVYLSEQEAWKVKEGQAVTISSAVLDEPRQAKVSMISDKADASGKFLAEVSFPNNLPLKLKAGMLADVHFPVAGTASGLSIPFAALLAGVQDAKVYVVHGDKVEKRSIKIGFATADKVQVLDGLSAGEQVVVSGQLNLEEGTNISINK